MPAVPQAILASIAILRAHQSMMAKVPRKTKKTRRAVPRARKLTLEQAARAAVEVFEHVGTRWTLVGAGAYAMLVEPRASEDFDFVVEGEKLEAVLDGLRARFGRLDTTDIGAAVRIKRPPLDLIRSSTHTLFAAALEHASTVEDWRVPTPEMFIVLKFLASVSPWRGPDRKAQDAADLVRTYLRRGRARLDMTQVMQLAGEVYPGAERELAELLRRVDAGERIMI